MFHRKKGEPRVLKGKIKTLAKRGGTLLLVLALLVTMLPMSVSADETNASNESSSDVITGETQDGYGDKGEGGEGNETENIGTENPEGETVSGEGNETVSGEGVPGDTNGNETTTSWTDTLSMQQVMLQKYDAVDNVALFQAYVEELLQGTGGFTSGIHIGAASEGALLSGVSRNAYQLILNQIGQIANGSATSTTVTLSAQELGILGGWSMEELGLVAFAGEEAITYALAEKLWMELDYRAVLSSLRIDVSKALYWFDPTAGVSIHLQGGIRQNGDTTQAVILSVQFRFAVSAMFQGGGSYTTDASYVLDAQAALAKVNGYTIGQGSTSSTEPSNGGTEAIATLAMGEEGISTQANTGEVTGIHVERDFEETALKDLTFQGGDIYEKNAQGEITGNYAPTDSDRWELITLKFYRAYVESDGVRYPISWIQSKEEVVNGKQVTSTYYVIDDGGSKSANTVKATLKVKDNDKIIFSYKTQLPSHNITYQCVNETNTDILKDTMLTALGGFRDQAQLVRRVNTISNGQIVYFQIRRIPGTNLSVIAENANGTNATVTDVTAHNSSGDTEFVTTYRLTNTQGAVTVKYTSTWKKEEYKVSLTMRSVAYSSKSLMAGSLRVEEYRANGAVKGTNVAAAATNFDTRTVLTVSATSTLQSSIVNNTVLFSKVHNTIYAAKEATKWYQVLAGMSVAGEAITLPTAQGIPAVTTLTKGEAYGTTITVTMEGTLDVLTDISATAQVPVYTILVNNLHSDVSIQMEYSPMGSTQATYAIMSTTGVEAQVYLKQDWFPYSILWQSLSAGAYYYEKNAVTPITNRQEYVYTIRWKNKPGYYNSELKIVANDANKKLQTYTYYTGDTTTATGNKKKVLLGTDGYYTVKLTDLRAQANSIAYISFTATPLYYAVEYQTGEGTVSYDTGTTDPVPSDSKIYDSALDDQLILSKLRPQRTAETVTDQNITSTTHYVFEGYKILEDASGKVYQPGTTVDLSQLRLSVAATLETQRINGKLTLKLHIQPQWRKVQGGDTMFSSVLVYLRQPDGTQTTLYEWVQTQTSGTYKITVDETKKRVDDYELEYVENADGTRLSGTVGTTDTTQMAQIFYEYKADATFSLGDEITEADIISGSLPATQKGHAYVTEVTLPQEQLIVKGYLHIGWKDISTGINYLFDGTVSQSEDSGVAVLAENTQDAGDTEAEPVDDGFAVANTLDDGYAVADTMDNTFGIATLSEEETSVGSELDDDFGISFLFEDGTVAYPEGSGVLESGTGTSSASGGTTMVIADANGIPIYTYEPGTYQESADTTISTQATANTVTMAWNGLNFVPFLQAEEVKVDTKTITISPELAASVSNDNDWFIDQVNARVVNPGTGAVLRKATVSQNNVSNTVGDYTVTFTSGDSQMQETITVKVYDESMSAQNVLLTQEEVTKYLNDGTLNQKLIQFMNAKAWVTGNTSQNVAITNVVHQIEAKADSYTVTFYTAYGTSTSAHAIVTPTVEEFTASPVDQTASFVATLPGETIQEALDAAGVDIQAALQALPGISVETILKAVGGTSGSALRSSAGNFIIVGPNNSGFVISGASGTGYIFANKDGTGYTLPGAGGNFLITGTHDTGFQVTAPNGDTFDVIGNNDTGFLLVSEDNELFTILGNSVSGFVVVSLRTLAEELGLSSTTTDTVQSPLTDGEGNILYLFGFVGAMLLALLCVLQWNAPWKKKR
jgi:hypothetical protein